MMSRDFSVFVVPWMGVKGQKGDAEEILKGFRIPLNDTHISWSGLN